MTRGEEAGRTGGERGACLRGPRSILPDGAPAQLWRHCPPASQLELS